MNVELAKTAGFCFGVKRAVDTVYKQIEKHQSEKIFTYGPIIHNEEVIKDLRSHGVEVLNDEEELKTVDADVVVIRSHGVAKYIYDIMDERGITCVDATCPFVKRNQEIAKGLAAEGKKIVLVGEKKHPEMLSVAEWAGEAPYIVETMEDVEALPDLDEVHIVIQTTFSLSLADRLITAIKRKAGSVSVHKTICNATSDRQTAAGELARNVDVMIVIGGRNSANTGRLVEVCQAEGAVTHHIETAAELKKEWFHSQCKVGITAGASTPDWIIEEVFFIMEDMNEMLEQEEMNLDVHKGSVVEGKVVDLTDDKAWISFGYKTEAVLPLHEYSYPEPASLKDVLQVGDSLRVQVVSSVKEDSTIFVSKIKVDRLADWDVAKEAFDKGEPVECEGIEAIKVGLLVQLKSLRGFIPLSQGDLRFVHSLQSLVGQKFKAKILEVDPTKNRLVLSRKAVLEEIENSVSKAFETGMGTEAFTYLESVSDGHLVLVAPEKAVGSATVRISAKDGMANAACVDVVAAPHSNVSLTISFEGSSRGSGFAGCGLRVFAGVGAEVEVSSIQALDGCWTVFDDSGYVLDDDAHVAVTHRVLGADSASTGLSADLRGNQSRIDVVTRYLGAEKQKRDFNYSIKQRGCLTESNLDANGVLAGESKKTLRGTIDFVHGCKGSTGNERETVLLADKNVVNKTVPVILCDEDDVMGNHGATIGHVRPEQHFYLSCRGLSDKAIESLFAVAALEEAHMAFKDDRIKRGIAQLALAKGIDANDFDDAEGECC